MADVILDSNRRSSIQRAWYTNCQIVNGTDAVLFYHPLGPLIVASEYLNNHIIATIDFELEPNEWAPRLVLPHTYRAATIRALVRWLSSDDYPVVEYMDQRVDGEVLLRNPLLNPRLHLTYMSRNGQEGDYGFEPELNSRGIFHHKAMRKVNIWQREYPVRARNMWLLKELHGPRGIQQNPLTSFAYQILQVHDADSVRPQGSRSGLTTEMIRKVEFMLGIDKGAHYYEDEPYAVAMLLMRVPNIVARAEGINGRLAESCMNLCGSIQQRVGFLQSRVDMAHIENPWPRLQVASPFFSCYRAFILHLELTLLADHLELESLANLARFKFGDMIARYPAYIERLEDFFAVHDYFERLGQRCNMVRNLAELFYDRIAVARPLWDWVALRKPNYTYSRMWLQWIKVHPAAYFDLQRRIVRSVFP